MVFYHLVGGLCYTYIILDKIEIGGYKMGQRLNLEIVINDETVANAYYHWSGYTSSSLELAMAVLNNMDGVLSEYSNECDIVKAIRLLESTGAGLTASEKRYVSENMKVQNKELADCNGRNEGLIAVSEQGMGETRNWEEARVTIDITNECVVFSAICVLDFDEYKDIYSDEDDVDDLEKVTFNYDTSCISFRDFLDFKNDLDELHDRGIYSFIMNDEVYIMIA